MTPLKYAVLFYLMVCSVPAKADAGFVDAVVSVATEEEAFVIVEVVSRTSGELPSVNALYRDPELRELILNGVALGHNWNALDRAEGYRGAVGIRTGEAHPMRGIIRVFIEDDPIIVRELGIFGTPGFVIFSHEGKIVARREGLPDAKQFARLLFSLFPEEWAYEVDEEDENDSEKKTAVSEKPDYHVRKYPEKSAPSSYPAAGYYSDDEPDVDNSEGKADEAGADEEVEADDEPIDELPSGESIGEIDPAVMVEPSRRMVREFSSSLLWNIEMTAAPADIDLDLEILDPRGNMLAISERVTGAESVSVLVGPHIPYTIVVYSIRRDIAPVQFRLKERTAPVPPRRIAPSADPILFEKAGVPITFEMRPGIDPHFRFFPLSAGRYRFEADADAVSGAALKYYVVNSAGEILGSSRMGQIDVLVQSPGSLTFVVRAEPGEAQGNLTVWVDHMDREMDEPDDKSSSSAVIQPLLAGSTVTGFIGGAERKDAIYRIENPVPTKWDLVVSGTNADVSISLEVLSAEGVLFERWERIEAGMPIRIEAEEEENLYLRLFTLDRGDGTAFGIRLYHAE